MSKYSVFYLAELAEQMRNSQKLYFELIAKAKKSKLPADFAAANIALRVSKDIEQSFDQTIQKIKEAQP